MKTRIIQTRFWDDEFVFNAKKDVKLLYLYLLTSPYINISGIFQLDVKKIMFETDLSLDEFNSAKNELEKANKVYFFSGWVYVKNAEKNNNYKNSDSNIKAFDKEMERVPENIKLYFFSENHIIDSTVDTSVDSTVYSTHKSEIINNKSEIINQKKRKKIKKNSEQSLKLMEEQELTEIVEHYNQVFGAKTRSTKGFESNYRYWRGDYSKEEILTAITNARVDPYWQDKMDLTIFFRRKNPRGEPTDWIGKFQARASPEKKLPKAVENYIL